MYAIFVYCSRKKVTAFKFEIASFASSCRQCVMFRFICSYKRARWFDTSKTERDSHDRDFPFTLTFGIPLSATFFSGLKIGSLASKVAIGVFPVLYCVCDYLVLVNAELKNISKRSYPSSSEKRKNPDIKRT